MLRRTRLHAAIAFAGLGLLLLAPRAFANWGPMPGAVQASALPAHVRVATAPDGVGGLYVAWNDSLGPDPRQNAYVKIQHFDWLGNALWPPGGINLDLGSEIDQAPPVDVCSDNSGGVFVAWNKYVDDGSGFVGHRIRAVHLDLSGATLSPFLDVSTNTFPDPGSPTIASDGQGGAIVTWIGVHGYGGTYPCGDFYPSTLQAQRISGSGLFLWGSAPRAVSPIYNVHPGQRGINPVRAVTAGQGVYFVFSALEPNCDNGYVKIQRLDLSSGLPTFDPGGLVLESEPGAVPFGYAFPTTNDACLVVVDGFLGAGLYVKRVSSSGSIDWTTTLSDRWDNWVHPESDGLNGVLVPWYRGDIGLMVQNVDAAGQLKFPQLNPTARGTVTGDGTFNEPGDASHVAPDGKGGAVMATACARANNPLREIYCQGVNYAGRTAFRASGLQVSPSGQSAGSVSMCHGLLNNVMLAWGNGNGVWAQQVTLSNLDVLTPPPGWTASLMPRANAGASANSVGPTVLIEGNQTWLNWAVLQRGPNPTAAFQSRVYLDGNPTSSTLWGQNVGDAANPGYYEVLNYGPFNIPGGPHTLTLYSDEEFGPDFSIDEATESDDVWGHQWIWEPATLVPGPEAGAPIGGFKGNSEPPNGVGHKFMVPAATAAAPNAWVVSLAARRGPTLDGSGGVLSYGDSYGLMLYDLPADLPSGAGEFTHLIGESHQPYNGTNFVVSMVPALPDSLYPLEVRDSTADSTPDSSQFDLEFAGARVGAGDASSWMGQAMAPGELADVYVLDASPGQTLHMALTRRESQAGGDGPLSFEVFPPAAAGGQATFVRGGGLSARAMSADVETLTFVAPQAGPNLVVVYRPNGTNAGTPLTYDFESSGAQTLDAKPKRLEFAFAGAEPNPVRVDTEFAFTVPSSGAASLVLYDVSGRAVRDLVRGSWDAGTHRVRWDGCGADGARLGAGLYFARFTCGTRTSVRRVAVVP